MTDLNEIFGYKVYKPPKEEMPVVPELNVYGEIVTMIDPNADVIEDPTVQALLETMDGERTVKVEDLAPDVRYDGWSRRVEYDDSVIKNRTSTDNLKAQEPIVNQTLLQPTIDKPKPFSLNTARPEVADLLAEQKRQQELQHQQFALKQQQIQEQQRQLEEKKLALFHQKQLEQQKLVEEQKLLQLKQQQQYQEQAILYKIRQIQQQARSSGAALATADQQAQIQRLLLDLARINPQLALETLQQFKQEPVRAQQVQIQPQQAQFQPQQAQFQAQPQAQAQPQQVQYRTVTEPTNLVYNMGSILPSEPSEFTQAPPTAVKPTSFRPIQ